MLLKRLLLIALALLASPVLAEDKPAAQTQTKEEAVATKHENTEMAIFAGGCFWCMEAEFANVKGVTEVTSGYTGGHVPNPTYAKVSGGGTGHLEAIAVAYDPARVDYNRLLEIFWSNIDPLDAEGQFCDKGSQYRAGIFTASAAQEKAAQASKEKIEKQLGKPVATLIKPATNFYPAENEHQEYYIKQKDRYKRYRDGCGRDKRLQDVWQGKPVQLKD